jgi:hypothetical protein
MTTNESEMLWVSERGLWGEPSAATFVLFIVNCTIPHSHFKRHQYALSADPLTYTVANERDEGDTVPKSAPMEESASSKITKRTQEFVDWRGETLARLRQLILDADPEMEEEWKWVKPTSPGVPVWSHDGGVCTGEVYKQVVKLTFFRGASVKDPKKLFNSSLEGNVRRAIDIREGEKVNEAAFKELIHAAVEANKSALAERAAKKK